MQRRAFVALLTVAAARAGSVAAQPAAGVHRLGILAPTEAPRDSDPRPATGSIPKYLEELGYVAGRTLILEQRYAAGRLEDLPAMARDLVRLRVNVIVAIGSAATRAAMTATAVVPIVMLGNFDPVAIGLVKSLAKPEDNVTGVLITPAGTLAGKKLELLKAAVPRATRIAFLTHEDPGLREQEKETQAAAAALGVTLALTRLRGDDYEGAFAAMVASRPDALFVAAASYFVRDRKRIIELAARHRLPAMYEWPAQVEDGGFMSYGGDLGRTTRRVAEYVDRIPRAPGPATCRSSSPPSSSS